MIMRQCARLSNRERSGCTDGGLAQPDLVLFANRKEAFMLPASRVWNTDTNLSTVKECGLFRYCQTSWDCYN